MGGWVGYLRVGDDADDIRIVLDALELLVHLARGLGPLLGVLGEGLGEWVGGWVGGWVG